MSGLIGVIAAISQSGGVRYNITAGTIDDTNDDPLNSTAGIVFNRDGTIDQLDPSASQRNAATDWRIHNGGATVGDAYEVRYITHSGDALTSAATSENTWIALSADRTYSIFEGDIGTLSSVQTFVIRRAADNIVVASAIITLTATVDAGG